MSDDPARERSNRETGETRDLIIRVALQLFSELGYHETTMADIAEAASIGKGTIYWHFTSKQELFEAVIESGAKRLVQVVRQILDQPVDSREKLRRFILEHIRFYKQSSSLARILMQEHRPAKRKHRLWRMRLGMINATEQILKEGIETGSLRPLDVEIIAPAIVGAVTAYAPFYLANQRQQLEPDDIANHLVELIFNGLQ